MGDKNHNQKTTELSARERWRNFWNDLGEEALAQEAPHRPDAEQIKHSLLRRTALDSRAQLTPSAISDILEEKPPAPAAPPERNDEDSDRLEDSIEATGETTPLASERFSSFCPGCLRMTIHSFVSLSGHTPKVHCDTCEIDHGYIHVSPSKKSDTKIPEPDTQENDKPSSTKRHRLTRE